VLKLTKVIYMLPLEVTALCTKQGALVRSVRRRLHPPLLANDCSVKAYPVAHYATPIYIKYTLSVIFGLDLCSDVT
jgi:hypothetical protein